MKGRKLCQKKENAVQRIRNLIVFICHCCVCWIIIIRSEYTPTEARVLFEIYQNDGCNAAFIAKVMNIDKSYLSRIIRTYEKKGYLVRNVSETDSRAYQLHLTETGLFMIEDFIQKSNQQVGEIIKPLNQKECVKLINALNTATAILEGCSKAE